MGLMFIASVTLVNLFFIVHLNGDISPHRVTSKDKIYDIESKRFLDEISAIHNKSSDIEADKDFLLSLIRLKRHDRRDGQYTYLHYNYIRKYMREIFDKRPEDGVYEDNFYGGLNISFPDAGGVNIIPTSGLPSISECRNSHEQTGNNTFTQVGVRFGKYIVEPYRDHTYDIFYNIGINSIFGIGTFVGYYTSLGIIGIERKDSEDFDIYLFIFHDNTTITMEGSKSGEFCDHYVNPLEMIVCKKRVKFTSGILVQFFVASLSVDNIVIDFTLGNGSSVKFGSFFLYQDIYDTNIQSHTAFIDTFVKQERCCTGYTNQVYLFDPIYVPDSRVYYGTEYPLHNLFVETYEYGPNNCNDEERDLYTTLVPYNISYFDLVKSVHVSPNTTYNSVLISRGWNALMW